MSAPVKPVNLMAYQMVLYSRALHPELFPLRTRRVVRGDGFELEAWAMDGGHMLRFERHSLCACEVLFDREDRMPEEGVISNFLVVGDRDFDHRFEREKVHYMTTVQSETLSENLYLATLEEMLAHSRSTAALLHLWNDGAGRCLSMIDIQIERHAVHAQCYHLIANGGAVIRTQTIFEHRPK